MALESHNHLLIPFDRAVLCYYRASPERYVLFEDDLGGNLKTVTTTASEVDALPYFRIRFGYRLLADGMRCLAAFGPDFEQLPPKEKLIWRGHLIENPSFAESDPIFERWVERSLNGKWVEPGPKYKLIELIRLLRALTSQTIQLPLWRFENHQFLHYPIAENTDAYARAHIELYRLVVDGLSKTALQRLAEMAHVTLSEPGKTLNSLRELLPPRLLPKVYDPIKKCYELRQTVHGVPSTEAKPFAAFDNFRQDLLSINEGLELFKDWLEEISGANAKTCLERDRIMDGIFPKFIGPPRPESKLDDLKRAIGKTVRQVEFGETTDLSESIVLHFTDGSAISIQIGTNAMEIGMTIEGFDPKSIETDLIITWAPPVGAPRS